MAENAGNDLFRNLGNQTGLDTRWKNKEELEWRRFEGNVFHHELGIGKHTTR